MSSITIDTRLIGGAFREWTPKLRLDFGKKARRLSDEDFFEFCRENPDVRIEMDKNGDIDIMPPAGGETGIKNFILTVKFAVWIEKKAAAASIPRPDLRCRMARDARPICRG
jgi:Uma2 family endonuclease